MARDFHRLPSTAPPTQYERKVRKLHIIWLIAALVAIVIVMVIVRIRKVCMNRKENKRLYDQETPVRSWVLKAINHQYAYDYLVNLGPVPDGNETYRDQESLQKALHFVATAQERLAYIQQHMKDERREAARLARHVRVIMRESDLLTRFWALHELFQESREELGGRNQKWLSGYMAQILPHVMDALWEQGTKRSLRNMLLLDSAYYGRNAEPAWHWDYDGRLIEGNFVYPEGWNEVVAKLFRAPSLHDFVKIQNDPPRGKLRRLAGEALEEKSILKAKLVLAYCNSSRESRYTVDWLRHTKEVGPYLLGKLSRFVASYHLGKVTVEAVRNT